MANQFPGDFSLREVNLYSMDGRRKIDIKALVLEITLYESILSSALQATLAIEDIGQNLISSLPIMGQERVEIIISSDGYHYNLNFYVYMVDGRSMKERAQTYVLSCISLEGIRNENYRICERIEGKKSNEIITEILRRDSFSTKRLDVDETVFPFDMYVPNWRVFDLFNWLSTRSVPEYKQDSIGFLFYETFEGFRYKSIDALLDQDEYPRKDFTYTYFPGNTSGPGLTAADKYRIMNYASPKAFNIYDDLRRGAFCHDSIYVDVNRATYRVFRTNADEFWDSSSHLEKTKPYLAGGIGQMLSRGSRFIYRPSTISTFGDWENIDDSEKNNIDDINKNFEKAFYRYYFLEYNQLDIAVPGDLRNRAGNVINIAIPDPKKERADRVKIDKRISGRYIVAAVKHTILNRSELRTNITLSRDSFGGSRLPDIEVSGGQVNLDGTN